MNEIVRCYLNDGSECELDKCDYVQLKLISSDEAYALVSKRSVDVILSFKWYVGKDGYPTGYGGRQRGIKMHKLVMQGVRGKVIDHINRNKLDNRLENLRICTYKENSYNTSRRNNKFKGVKKISENKYAATISKDGVSHSINNISSETEAAKIYDMMAEELFGTFAGKNFGQS
ncbi:MAG: HNH endonuclease [Hyperionvirus sp.]|uniref:HNH endonuclease n=1 Tax=Hyperionvirus sp. TaxID=2487770 RepID=A0A3G5A8N4_9VIRU|nr:MAG: HNH endonuclease [Hyperionvirus sp.]